MPAIPKPPGQVRHRGGAPPQPWTTLETDGRRRRKPPPLPDLRDWSPATLVWWSELWKRPEAAMWDPSGFTLAPCAFLYESLVRGEGAPAPLLGELRAWLDRHGLNPRARALLRWSVDTDSEAGSGPAPARSGSPGSARRRRLARSLEVLEGGGRTTPAS